MLSLRYIKFSGSTLYTCANISPHTTPSISPTSRHITTSGAMPNISPHNNFIYNANKIPTTLQYKLTLAKFPILSRHKKHSNDKYNNIVTQVLIFKIFNYVKALKKRITFSSKISLPSPCVIK